MRLIKTFILRINTDPDQNEQFCGEIQALLGKRTFPFKNKSEMLNLLLSLINKKVLPDKQDVDLS
jgi:hypothetical protein